MQRQHEIAIAVRGLKKSYRSVVRPMLRSREVLIVLALILLPVALAFLLVYIAGSTVCILERLLLVVILGLERPECVKRNGSQLFTIFAPQSTGSSR